MAETTTSRQKAEYVSHELTTRGKSEYVQLVYKRLDGENPGTEQKTGAFVAKLDKESKDRIKAGGTFVVVKTKEGDFWNLSKVEDISTYVAKAPSNYSGNRGSYTTKPAGNAYNTAGVKVGAVLHDAVALYAANGGAPNGESTIKCVKTIAEELLTLAYELESNVKSGKYEPKTNTTKPTTKSKETVEPESGLEDINLETIDF